jgi:ATP-dependent DNA helicase RecG
MSKSQKIEYKSSCHDDYLKWVCGFANAQGSNIYIGKDDAVKVIGLEYYAECSRNSTKLTPHGISFLLFTAS